MILKELKQEMHSHLTNNILRFWLDRMIDNDNGGFYGRIDGNDNIVADAEKGAILNARILWAFAAAYRVIGNKEYLDAALRAKDYILNHFIDKQYGGVYWSLNADGTPKDTKKQSYAIGFTIYGMSELARATGDREALECALNLYHSIEEHAFDAKNNGYIEALTRDWQPIADMRLSDKDENGSRTMNTHLHIIEPYTNLYRACPSAELKERLVNLLHIFTDKLLNKQTHHLDLFFNDEWQGKRNIQSFGHDIEASWLLHETALILGDKDILEWIEPVVKDIAVAADEGLLPDGSMIMSVGLIQAIPTALCNGGCNVRMSLVTLTFGNTSASTTTLPLLSVAGIISRPILLTTRMVSGTGASTRMALSTTTTTKLASGNVLTTTPACVWR